MKHNKEQWWLDFFKGDFSEVVLNQQAHETLVFMQQVGKLAESMNIYDQCVSCDASSGTDITIYQNFNGSYCETQCSNREGVELNINYEYCRLKNQISS